MTPTTSTPSTPTLNMSPLEMASLSSANRSATAASYRKRKHRSQNNASDNEFSDDECSPKSGSPSIDDDRRAHHNELERRRRDHIKDHFQALKNSIPLLEGEKSSRALILKRAVDYISLLQSQVKEFKMEVEETRRHNDALSQQLHGGLRPMISQLQMQQQQQHHTNRMQMPVAMTSPPQQTQQTSPFHFSNGAVASTSIGDSLSSVSFVPSAQSSFISVGETPSNTASSPAAAAQLSASDSMLRPNLSSIMGLSQLLLQNPLLAQQLHAAANPTPSPDSLSPPNGVVGGNNGGYYSTIPTATSTTLSDVAMVESEAQMLVKSLALRERQLAAAIRL